MIHPSYKEMIEKINSTAENGDMKISEVAQRCGYENLKFFNSLFKQTLGMTPREFKKLYKK